MRIPAVLCLAALLGAPIQAADPYVGWTVYGGGPASLRYSALDQINRGNVARLAVAWTYDTGDAFKESEMECNPIVVNGLLYATTPKLRLIALDAATGKLRWSFDPRQQRENYGKSRNRGVTYWAAPSKTCPSPPPAPASSIRTCSSWAASSAKLCLPRPAISAPTTSAPARSAGPSIPSRTPASSATTPGPKTPGSISARPITGPA